MKPKQPKQEFSPEFLELLARAREAAEDRGHAAVTSLHAVAAMALAEYGVFTRLFGITGTNVESLRRESTILLDAIRPTNGNATLQFTEDHSLIVASLAEASNLNIARVLSEHLLLAVVGLKEPATARLLEAHQLTRKSVLEAVLEIRTEPQHGDLTPRRGANVPTSALEQFGRDLMEEVTRDDQDPVIGRDAEIAAVIQVLLNRRKQNALLIGETGTGKSAVCRALALRMAAGDVPKPLRGVRLVEIDLARLSATASTPGAFAANTHHLIEEVVGSEGRIVLVVDQAHALITTTDGSVSVADLLRPVLARSAVRLIGRTTQAHYAVHIEPNGINSLLLKVPISEPSEAETVSILRGLKDRYERAHGILIRDSGIQAAARLAARYVSGQFLPGKAVDLLDRVCSRARMELLSVPEDLDHDQRELQRIRLELAGIELDPTPEAADTRDSLTIRESLLATRVRERKRAWEVVSRAVIRRQELEAALWHSQQECELLVKAGLANQAAAVARDEVTRIEADLGAINDELARSSEKRWRDRDQVTDRDVAEEVARMTGIPVGSIATGDEEKRYAGIADALARRVVGQKEAVDAVSRSLRRMIAGLKDPNKPIGTFMFLGPTGVGKTELAKALAEFLFGDERFLTRLDMSEFVDDQIAIAKLIGSGPGYVGYADGGMLTEPIRKNPYSVLLLDEVEKAHPKVFDTFLQVLEDARVTDGLGRTISFANVLVLMTSNLAARSILDMTQDNRPSVLREVEAELARFFKPEFRNRLTEWIVFGQLETEEYRRILGVQLTKLKELLREKRIEFEGISDEARDEVLRRCSDRRFGARPLIRFVERELRGKLADRLLAGDLPRGSRVRFELTGKKEFEVRVTKREQAG